MTIDERIEALTQSIELLGHIQRDNETAWPARWDAVTQAIAQDAENIRGLVRIAEIHERRLSRLEEA